MVDANIARKLVDDAVVAKSVVVVALVPIALVKKRLPVVSLEEDALPRVVCPVTVRDVEIGRAHV